MPMGPFSTFIQLSGNTVIDWEKRLTRYPCSGGRNSWSPLTSPIKISSDMTGPTVTLYTFLGVHSFLIGLFPFYIPVFLYKNGFFLSRICAFIAVTALGFVITLYPWERMARKVSLAILILVSFFSELLLMLAVITFCTSLFRLVFNKRFYDIAAATTGHADIFIKSYISQFFLAAGAMSGVLWLGPGNKVAQLSGIYLAAAAFSFVFLLYHLEKR